LIAACARWRPRPVRSRPFLPRVTIVLVVHDEARRIVRRIENLLAQDYPRDRVGIIVCSDGSTDATVALARERAATEPRVKLLAFERWRGKPAALNEAVAQATGEIVVFADARQNFERCALAALVEPFADASVGAVSGELCLLSDPSAAASV